MTAEVLSVAPTRSRSVHDPAVRLSGDSVVDLEQRLVGIVTVDDVIDVIEQEATRDLYAAGAVQAGDDDDYFSSSLFTVARRRVWLAVLVVQVFTSEVIAAVRRCCRGGAAGRIHPAPGHGGNVVQVPRW